MPNAKGDSAIGLSFGQELDLAGLHGLNFSWGSDGSFAWGDVTDQQKAAVQAVYAKHDPTAVVAPIVVSRWQFAQQGTVDSLCTQDEALAWAASGTAIPQAIATLVAALPAGTQFAVKMKLCATTIDRTDPTTIELTNAFGWDDAKRLAFWAAASQH